MVISNDQIANKLMQLADLLEVQGTNPFRLRAYRNAAKAIKEHPESIEALVEKGFDLTEISGVGKAVAEKCEQLVKTGTIRQFDELLEQLPLSLLDLLAVPKLGPQKVSVIFKQLGISNLQDLKTACEGGKIAQLPGFGSKTEQAILEGIAIAEAANLRTTWANADQIAQQLRQHFENCPAVERLEFAGSYRRGKDTIGDLDVLVMSEESAAVMDHFAKFPGISGGIARGETKMSIYLEREFQVDLRVVPASSFGAALQYFTGSKEHNVIVRSMAKQRKLKVNEWGVFKLENEQEELIAGSDEADVYRLVGLPWIPPELREARQEFEWAVRPEGLPQLIELTDIQGDLHMHTDASDGSATIQEMADAARARGLQYIAITDHSKRVTMANGLNGERLMKQWRTIDELNPSFAGEFRILKGVECDILEDGSLDLSDQVLSAADWVTASIHYGQQQSREQITERILNAIRSPFVHCISHPTGRLINRRKAYEVDMLAVFQAAVEHGKFLELNAAPKRLDLHDLHCAQAISLGIKIVINTDAHHPGSLQDMRYGVLQARRGGVTRDDVANTRPLSEFLELLSVRA
ncbi:MAG TPA: DNA polymerase/3'-5' exonuclease PolX [Pirellulaceae bacterium]|nr:DNA polymerase/3'-5' exonuclease PolX [Pirellulaceae bacterium]HMP71222.1 DNA polymerase/3'-5' exonuclease PolX [Pirellulaceae bacterium]